MIGAIFRVNSHMWLGISLHLLKIIIYASQNKQKFVERSTKYALAQLSLPVINRFLAIYTGNLIYKQTCIKYRKGRKQFIKESGHMIIIRFLTVWQLKYIQGAVWPINKFYRTLKNKKKIFHGLTYKLNLTRLNNFKKDKTLNILIKQQRELFNINMCSRRFSKIISKHLLFNFLWWRMHCIIFMRTLTMQKYFFYNNYIWYDNNNKFYLDWAHEVDIKFIAVEQTSQISTIEFLITKQHNIVDEVVFAKAQSSINIPAFFWHIVTQTDLWYGLNFTSIPYYYNNQIAFLPTMPAFFRKNYNFLSLVKSNVICLSELKYYSYLINYILAYTIYKNHNLLINKVVEASVSMEQAYQFGIRAQRLFIFSFKKRAYTLTFASYYGNAIFTYSTGMFIPQRIKFFRSKSRRKQILTYLRSLKKKKRKQERRKLGLIRWKCLRRKFFLRVAMSRYVAALLTKCIRRARLNVYVHGTPARFKSLWHIIFYTLRKRLWKNRVVWQRRRKHLLTCLYFSNKYRTMITRRRVKRKLYKRLRL